MSTWAGRQMQREHELTEDLSEALGQPCPYCNNKMGKRYLRTRPTRDHILPESDGFNFIANRIICCQKCNNDKGSRNAWEWAATLREKHDWRAKIVTNFLRTIDMDAIISAQEEWRRENG